MTAYLISFPSGAMRLTPEQFQLAADAAHAVARQAKSAGVWVFGAAIDEAVPPVLVDAAGRTTPGAYPQSARIGGGYTVLDLPSREEAVAWAAKLARACRCEQELREFRYDPES